VTRKQELRDSEAAHPPLGEHRFTPLSACVRIGQSTGTTGVPTTMIWTRRDLEIEYESAARGFWRRGHRPGMIATHAHPAYLYGGGAILSGAYEHFGFVNLWVPPPETDALADVGLRAWMRFRPDLPYKGFAIGRYLEACQRLGLDPQKDVGLPAVGGGGGRARMPLLTAGIECYTFLGDVCGQGEGAHLNEDWALVEAIDPESGRAVPEGEWGALVVTTLDRDNGLLRYDLEEACAIVRGPCGCGETSARGFWGGRWRDLFVVQGRRFLVSDVEQALARVDAVVRPSLEWTMLRPRDPASPLVVRVELGEGDRETAAGACRAALRERLGIDARVELLARGALPRSGYKPVRVVEE
jgi:phenylacetate-CoA ligase